MDRVKKGLSLLKKIVLEKGFRFRLLYAVLQHIIRVKTETILYESYHSKSMTGNPYAIFLSLVNDSKFDGYKHVWILIDPSLVEGWRTPRVKLVKRNSFRHAIYLLSSKYLINNTTFASYVRKREGQIYINTWHGTPMKTLGDDVVGGIGLGGNVARNILQTDYLVLPNRFTVDRILGSFNLGSIYNGAIIESGHPRIDLSFTTEAEKKRLRKKLGIPDGRKVVLYAPTYRGAADNTKDEGEQIAGLLAALSDNYGSAYCVLYKGHYFQNLRLMKAGCVSIGDQQDTNELLGIVDVLITDYSSIAFDFLPLEKPIIYFAYDLELYTRERGLYFDLSDMPGCYCPSVDSVLYEIERIDQHMLRLAPLYANARKMFCKYDNGSVTQKIRNAIFLNITDDVNHYRIPDDGKKSILIYGGGYLNNGVTSSLMALLANIDYSRYAVTLISNSDTTGQNFQRLLENVPKEVNLFYVDNTGLRLFQKLFGLINSQSLARLFSNEYKLFFGSTHFDVAIDYSAYGAYWACLMAFSRSDKKCIYLHSDIRQEQERRPGLADYEFLIRLFEERFDKLITVSKSGYEDNSASLPALKSKFVKVDNPINAARIIRLSKESDSLWKDCLDRNKINFINIARYSSEKGQDRLIEAFSHIVKTDKNLHLYLVGHGLLYNNLRKQIISLGLEQRITLTGNIENPFPLLSACDCFILSSHYEGQGLVLLESMVLDIPCISTDIPGPRSVLSEGKGLLVENSVDGLIHGMRMFLENEVPQEKFDYRGYTKNAMSSFYKAIA